MDTQEAIFGKKKVASYSLWIMALYDLLQFTASIVVHLSLIVATVDS